MIEDDASIKIFSLYTQEDASLHQQLEKHLLSLKRQKLISLWSIDQIPAGADQHIVTSRNLNDAHIILLLLSADFVASEYYYNDVMQHALQLQMEKNIPVVLIILRPCAWEDLPIHAQNILPENQKPVTTWQDLDEAFANITQEIRKIVITLRNPAANVRPITQAQRNYLHWLIKRTSSLDTRGTFSAQRLPQIMLQDVYISLYAQKEEIFQDVEPAQAQEVPTTKTSREAPQSLSSLAAHHSHLIILGAPGSGKTTFLRYLALTHALALCDQGEESDSGDVRFPILLRIADYVAYGMHQEKSLSDFLADDCKRLECPSPVDILSTELQAGRCLVLLDGLDEVVRPDDRRMVVQRIEAFVRRYDDVPNRFILTSRGAGYHEAPLSEIFAHYRLQDLEMQDIQRFLESWHPALETALSPKETTTHEINDLMNTIQTVPGIGHLAANPLLLRILAQLHKTTNGPLPQQRVALYHQVTETLIQTWRTSQGVSTLALLDISPLMDKSSITRLLSTLAYWLHSQKPNGFASEEEICYELGKEWARLTDTSWREEDPAIEKAMRQFLHAVQEQTGILVEETPHWYGFTHLTFEEYYAAHYLLANRQERVQRIRTYLHNPRWQEVILLALGLAERESQEETHRLVEKAILARGEGLQSSPYETLLGRDYLFALRCLGENIHIHYTLVVPLIERLLREITQWEGPAGQFQKYQEALAEGLKFVETSSKYANLLLPLLMKNLEQPDHHLRLWSLYSLGRIGRIFPSDAVRRPLLKVLREGDSRLRSAALWSLSQLPGSEITVALLEILKNDTDMLIRQNTIQYLGERHDTSPQMRRALLDLLHEPLEYDGMHHAIIESLGQLGDASPEVISSLVACLHHNIRISASGDMAILPNKSALESLQKLSFFSPQVVPLIADAFYSAIPCVRILIAEALEKFNAASPTIIAALSNVPPEHSSRRIVQVPICAKQWSWLPEHIEALLLLQVCDSRSSVRWEAVKALGQWQELSDKAVEALFSLLQDEDSSVRTLTIKTLNTFEISSQDLNAFIALLFNDPSASVRACIAECFGDGDWPLEEIVPALIQAMHDEDEHVRSCVIKSLGTITPIVPAILDIFISSLLSDTSFGVRWEVVKNLQRLETVSETALSAVLQGLTDSEQAIRWDCALLLGQCGSCDERTLHALLHGLSDSEMNVRKACSQALIQLGQRYPEEREEITERLTQILQTSDETSSPHTPYGSLREVAYNALWFLEVGSPP